MVRPLGTHSCRILAGDHADAMRSLSKISAPWNPAAAAAAGLSSKAPDKHAVAIVRCGAVGGPVVISRAAS
jgi:hypothetical protein